MKYQLIKNRQNIYKTNQFVSASVDFRNRIQLKTEFRNESRQFDLDMIKMEFETNLLNQL